MSSDHTRALREVHDLLASDDPVDRLAEITEIVEEALAGDNWNGEMCDECGLPVTSEMGDDTCECDDKDQEVGLTLEQAKAHSRREDMRAWEKLIRRVRGGL